MGLEGQMNKQGTPTMGGLIILASIVIPTVLFADLTNIYTQMMLLVTVWLGAIGFIDDYIKVFKKNKDGLAGKFKIIGQIGVGLIVGSIMWWHPDVTVKDPADRVFTGQVVTMTSIEGIEFEVHEPNAGLPIWEAKKSSETTVPFLKDNAFDYERLISWLGPQAVGFGWIVFIPLVILIVTAVSNGANLTDGIDGLATGTSAIIGLGLAVLAYVSSNIVAADYLNINTFHFRKSSWSSSPHLWAAALHSFGTMHSRHKSSWATLGVSLLAASSQHSPSPFGKNSCCPFCVAFS